MTRTLSGNPGVKPDVRIVGGLWWTDVRESDGIAFQSSGLLHKTGIGARKGARSARRRIRTAALGGARAYEKSMRTKTITVESRYNAPAYNENRKYNEFILWSLNILLIYEYTTV